MSIVKFYILRSKTILITTVGSVGLVAQLRTVSGKINFSLEGRLFWSYAALSAELTRCFFGRTDRASYFCQVVSAVSLRSKID